MAGAAVEPGGPLPRTAAALRHLGLLLSCSRCRNLLKKPVSLGNCEHVFCLACVGDCVGIACPVCHIPNTVQDVKVSRKLDDITKLYRKLQKLQEGDIPVAPGCSQRTSEETSPPGAELETRPEASHREVSLLGSGTDVSSSWEAVGERGKNKQIKMWLSPRSGNMRFCHLKKRPEKSEQAVADQEKQPPVPTTSAYDFPSPSQEPFREAKKSRLKCNKKLRMRT
ncbi:BRCA1-associated RING domain protein 1 [Eublepharis macularius]|uniref:BRCA1-associated RING domain protein 1 n=1 Tax=Eublepharis macularius TaxID=481883 RepID=A0AA97KRR4_EUBMA|nr:BRCA1-associated RING domain protein 1 [Eublepharis macularius]